MKAVPPPDRPAAGEPLPEAGRAGRFAWLALAASLLLLLAVTSLLLARFSSLKKQLDQLQSQQATLSSQKRELEEALGRERELKRELHKQLDLQQSEREILEQELARLQQSQSSVISFSLSGDAIRGAGPTEKLVIPPNARLILFRLRIDNAGGFDKFRARLRRVGGEAVALPGARRLSNQRRKVVLSLSPSLLTTGDYILTLIGVSQTGEEEIEDYSFSVIKR